MVEHPPPTPVLLRVDGRAPAEEEDGRGVLLAASPHPRLSWQVPLCRPGQEQQSFRVQVQLHRGGGLVETIDSGVVASGDPWWVVPSALPADRAGTWTVSVQDEEGAWSKAASSELETGPHGTEHWQAQWLECPAGSSVTVHFHIRTSVRRARLHVTGQGLVRAAVDGIVMNPDSVDPSRTDVGRALYRTFDITDLCVPAEHTLTLTLGKGQWGAEGRAPRVLAEIVTESDDGELTRFGTDEHARCRASRVTVDEPFYLERHDLRLDAATPSAVAEHFLRPALSLDVPPIVTVDPGPPVRRTQRLPAVELPSAPSGRVFDVGVNISGRVELRLRGPVPRDTVIRLVHGEHLGADGQVDTTNLSLPRDVGRPRQVVEYVLDGRPDPMLEVWFSYAGFRYVEISGLPSGTEVQVVGCAVHSDVGRPSRLETDSRLIARLDGIARRTLLNNLHGLPEDCPTREQAAWTGDTASALDFDLAAFDMEAFFTKWLGDLVSSQLANGAIPAVAPRGTAEPIPADPVWGAALPRVLLGHWMHYGDRRVLESTLPALRRWTTFLLNCIGPLGVVDGAPISYGHDWLGLRQTPPELLHTSAALEALEALIQLETAAGDPAAAGEAAEAHDRIRTAARLRFTTPNTSAVANGSQAALSIALTRGLLATSDILRTAERLAVEIRREGSRVSSGFGGTRAVIEALSQIGSDDLVMEMLTQNDPPGIGAMLAHDIGTFWECWWVDATNTGTGSLDHVGLGAPFAAWIWRGLIGARPSSAGGRTYLVDPRAVPGVDHVNAIIPTIRGDLCVAWRRAEGRITLDIVVPVSMEVEVPATGDRLTSGHHQLQLPVVVRPPRSPNHEWRTFAPPVIARRADDLDSDATVLARARAEDAIVGLDGAKATVLPHPIVCMPVPHEQQPGPVLHVVGAHDKRRAVAQIEVDLDLRDARFLVAYLDTDSTLTKRRLVPVLVLHADDGSTRAAVARLWPAGWNRISVDVDQWPSRQHITCIEVGVQVEGDLDDFPPSVHVASIGWSARRRSW